MKTLSIGKHLGLQRISSQTGTFTCLALDHRQNLRRSINPADPAGVSKTTLSNFKLAVTAALAGESTAVLLEPEYSAAQAIAAGVIPNESGLVVALEATGYGGSSSARSSQILPGWSVEKAKRMGANAVKLLVYYHPEAITTSETENLVKQVAEDCSAADLVFMLESLTYSLKSERDLRPEEKSELVVETARRITPLGIDILKVEFPFGNLKSDRQKSYKACQDLSAVSVVPWILLSAAVDFEQYLEHTEISCQAGASGIAVGRAVWKEAVSFSGAARTKFLTTTGKNRMKTLKKLCDSQARPYTDFYKSQAPYDWYKGY